MKPRAARPPLVALFIGLVGAMGSLAGCHVYQFGASTLYRSDVQTVYVPMIESDSLRRGLGERLTEAVVKQIELRTPYKVVGPTGDADSELVCRIISDTKRIASETRTDEPRLITVGLLVQMEWVDRRRQSLLQRNEVPLPSDLVRIADDSLVAPEVGQTIAVGQQKVIERIAAQIVDQMEMAW